MSQNLYKIEFIGIPAQPIDTREYSTLMSAKLSAITSSIAASGGSVQNNSIHYAYYNNLIICGIPYLIVV